VIQGVASQCPVNENAIVVPAHDMPRAGSDWLNEGNAEGEIVSLVGETCGAVGQPGYGNFTCNGCTVGAYPI
jgi:hypothetical protein